jgi:hypothetical protein
MALRLAAELWAKARQRERPTAEAKDLDIDVILAAKPLSFGPAPPRTGARSGRIDSKSIDTDPDRDSHVGLPQKP